MPDAWHVREGKRGTYVFAIDDRHRQALVLRYAAEQRPVTVWSLDDLMPLIDGENPIAETMRLFPGASVHATKPKRATRPIPKDNLDDILPLPEENDD
jgi:hypothetical protein